MVVTNHTDNYHLRTLIVDICPCRYRSKVNWRMNRRCRHAVLGFLRRQFGVRQRGDCVVIHPPAPMVQIVR